MIKNFIKYCNSWLFDYIPNVSRTWYARLLVLLTSVSGTIVYILFLINVYVPYISNTKILILFNKYISLFMFCIILCTILLGLMLHLLATIIIWVVGVENKHKIDSIHDIIFYVWINILLLLLGITPIVIIFYVVYRLILNIISYFRRSNWKQLN